MVGYTGVLGHDSHTPVMEKIKAIAKGCDLKVICGKDKLTCSTVNPVSAMIDSINFRYEMKRQLPQVNWSETFKAGKIVYSFKI